MKKMRWLFWLIEVVVAIAVATLLLHWQMFSGKVIPGVFVSGVEVSGIEKNDLSWFLQQRFEESPNEMILKYNGEESLKAGDLQIAYDHDWTANLAMSAGRSGNLLTQIRERVIYFIKPLSIEPAISYDEEALAGLVTLTSEKVRQEYVPARIDLDDEGLPRFVTGADGVWVNEEDLTNLILKAMKMPGRQVIDVPVEKKVASFSEERVAKSLGLANKWLGKTMLLEYEDFKMELKTGEVVSLLGVVDKVNETAFNELTELVKKKINREPQDAVFRFEEGRVREFKTDLKGVELDKEEFKMMLENTLVKIEERLVLPVKLTEPEIKASEVNDLGIKELLGRGNSKFAHSIPGRVFNVALASGRVNYALIPPGEIFSFNKEVGEISALTGYRSAYVIKDGRTVLGDGGGVCQVSTTVFRAALSAGLPIVERKAHSYRVSYYEQDSDPGIDATVYAPTADIKFKNDTPGHLLIQTTVDTKNLTMKVEIFGTSDGRVSSISKPKVWGQSPPPEPLYEDDPTLPAGQVKQVDWAAWGAKTAFDYKVERDGEVLIDRTFYSNFRPWQAVYLRGVGS